MIYNKEMLNRVNIRHIRSLIFNGTADHLASEFDETYEERLSGSSYLLEKRIKKIYKDDSNELENALSEVGTIMREYRDVYTEIGMKIGAKLIFQLLYQDNC